MGPGGTSRQAQRRRPRRQIDVAIRAAGWLAMFLCLVYAPPLAEARTYPKIFGSIELPSKNLKKFPKWLDMIGRWKTDQ